MNDAAIFANLHVAYAAFEPFPNAKGSGTRIAQMLEALVAAGARVTLLTLPGRHVALPLPRGVEHRVLPIVEPNFLRRGEAFRERLLREFIALRPDVIHYRGIFESQAAEAYLRHRWVPRVFEVNGLFSVELHYHYPRVSEASEFQRKLRAAEARALGSAELIVTQSRTTRAFLADRSPDLERRSVVVPNAADPADYRVAERLEHRRTAESRHPSLFYAGTLAPWQGVSELLMATRRVVRHTPVTLSLAGPVRRRWRKQLERVIKKLGLSENVRLLGPLTRRELATRVLGSDVCVAPLRRDRRNADQGCSPLKLFEYMAAARPIVSTDLPCVREIVSHESTALLATSTRPSALADSILRLVNDSDLARELGNAARARILADCSWHHRHRGLLEAYRKHLFFR